MRFDHGSGGKEFWTTWWEHNGNALNTPEFKAEFQQLVDELRRGPLKDRTAMSSYCNSHAGELDTRPVAAMDMWQKQKTTATACAVLHRRATIRTFTSMTSASRN